MDSELVSYYFKEKRDICETHKLSTRLENVNSKVFKHWEKTATDFSLSPDDADTIDDKTLPRLEYGKRLKPFTFSIEIASESEEGIFDIWVIGIPII